jgi:predicted O-linked N-acetylglucosamine transferase (SPINDLY family)
MALVLVNAARAHLARGEISEAKAKLEQVVRLDPTNVGVLNQLGVIALDEGKVAISMEYHRKAVGLRPDTPEVHYNLGNVLRISGRLGEALEAYDRALEVRPDYARARLNRGLTLHSLGRFDEAKTAFHLVVGADPHNLIVNRLLFKGAIGACDFDEAETRHRIVTERLERNLSQMNDPLFLGNVAYDHLFHPLAASLHEGVTTRLGELLVKRARRRLAAAGAGSDRGKLRIGYMSPNFGNHPVGHVFRSFFRQHDRSRFEIVGYATKDRSRESEIFHRDLKASFDDFVNLTGMSAREAAERIHQDRIDILVDLDGYMDMTSPPIMAHRPAPVQAFWVGHAGGLGLPFVDYLLADRVVVPDPAKYREAVAWLPEVYHPADRAEIGSKPPSRAVEGLADGAFVFCAFNNPEKIDRKIFQVWMRILRALPDSQLWISDRRKHGDHRPNLQRSAAEAGVSPQRIVFAGGRPEKADHLARHALADLFLDTLTVSAATTALDALWAGLPVLTCPGDRFASRMAASFLTAIGLPELICGSIAEYERRAIELAGDPQQRRHIADKLGGNRLTHPLFDPSRLARHVEDAFLEMWRRHRAGSAPAHFAVPPRPR